MNIFGLGGAELVVIIMIMLIVAGPKRMIRWAYVIGQYVGKFRIMWEQMVDIMQDEVDQAGLDVKLPREIPTRQNLARSAEQFLKPYTEPIQETLDEVKKPVQETIDETTKVVEAANKDLQSTTSKAKPSVNSQQAVAIPEPPEIEAASPSANGDENGSANFGAWSNPQSPAQQEREA